MYAIIHHSHLKRQHGYYILQPIIQNFTHDTTIAVILLNPMSNFLQATDEFRAMLAKKGYTRLYTLFLYTFIGSTEELAGVPPEDLISESWAQRSDPVIMDLGTVVFAFDKPKDQEFAERVLKRAAEVEKRIRVLKPSLKIVCLGNDSIESFPKPIEALVLDDIPTLDDRIEVRVDP
jgi:hypothetical protein